MEYKVDLHGLTVIESKIKLDKTIDALSWDYDSVLVVHGYHSDILLNYVRKEYKHKRLKLKILPFLNQGETTLVLYNKEEYAILQEKRDKKKKKKR